jgi:hypothetical protein
MPRWFQNRGLWAATFCLIALAGLALVIDHRSHVLGTLPYLLLLACPLMHLRHAGLHGHATLPGPRDESQTVTSSPEDARAGGTT